VKLYSYSKCSTCQRALKYANTKGRNLDVIDITENPPSLKELKQMLAILKAEGGSLKDLFNTSGVQYRELKMSEKLKAGMSESEALKLLSTNGRLIKRPFLIGKSAGTVGFKPEIFAKILTVQSGEK
jgi:arsenate reductase